jgi:hypothetical protein
LSALVASVKPGQIIFLARVNTGKCHSVKDLIPFGAAGQIAVNSALSTEKFCKNQSKTRTQKFAKNRATHSARIVIAT